jgi:prepilin-type N-terminal cleavage/methylation domain-containing protein
VRAPVRGLGGEAGFTLVELLVVCVILGMVMAGSLGLYKIAQETYTSTSGLVDSQAATRAAIDRMATDLRLAGSYLYGATNAPNVFSAVSSSAFTFLGDVDGDTLSAGAEATASSAVTTSVVVSSTTGFSVNEYLYIASGLTQEVRQISAINTATNTLTLSAALTNAFVSTALTPVTVRSVESVAWTYDASAQTLTRQVGSATAEIVAANVSGLTLTYYNAANTVTTTASDVRRVKISLTTGTGATKRTLEVDVQPLSLRLS